MKIVTIGVYGSTEEQFFGKLVAARVDLFGDIRQRRGVRGAKYAFVNSERLQSRLRDLGIGYLHLSSLAPTSEIRAAQKRADAEVDIGKRERVHLSPVFARAYAAQVLDKFDLNNFEFAVRDTKVLALFCVEERPQACHRSLASVKLATALSAELEDL